MSRPSAIDLFAGAGGATRGLRDAGFRVLAAVENDPEAAESYRRNHARVLLYETDIRSVSAERIAEDAGLQRGELDLLKACPPCQGFSSLAKGEVDQNRNDLVLDVARFVEAFLPKILLLENVPGLKRDRRLPQLVAEVERLGYSFLVSLLDATEFGVPQRRKRFILMGVRADIQHFEPDADLLSYLPSKFLTAPKTARQALAHLARHNKPDDPLGSHRRSSEAVLARISAIPVGGNRFDLPEEHQLDCHRKLKNRSASGSYGRIRLDEPAPTMTTRCTTPACGTFVHPTENRGLTLREAATFQSFPVNYQFHGQYGSIERQIGNAVPVRMAKGLGLIARSLLDHSSTSSVERPTTV
ncbi:DNA cytosine methyltransferase [Streptomyces sp. NPDC057376]|uniref:DNA cytosine methyltransferase n=1 Tax=unclassified Streptomyces TaxID=2593676 RepID=UPI0009403E47|nr:DNA cytosine methyltransferase [Streptomyces sp. CB02414]